MIISLGQAYPKRYAACRLFNKTIKAPQVLRGERVKDGIRTHGLQGHNLAL